MPVKNFADTSAVSIAYAIDGAADSLELVATEFNYVPYTSEGFQLTKETQISTAITDDRRVAGSKNTRGSAAGAASLEFGYTPFINDMLQLSLMSTWEQEMQIDGTTPTGSDYILDGEITQFFVAEKRVRNTLGTTPWNFFERFFGNLVNEATIEIGTSELISFSVSTMAAFGDLAKADATSDEDAGGMATTYVSPDPYEIADASNNIQNVVLKDSGGTPLEVTFSTLSLSIGNNIREQLAVGHEFSAGMAMGKVNVQLSGTVYFYDDTVLQTHLQNNTVSAEITVVTDEGTYLILLPRLKSEAPAANSQGENQDYTQSMTLNAERGTVAFTDTVDRTCVIAILRTPTP